jgi:integrase
LSFAKFSAFRTNFAQNNLIAIRIRTSIRLYDLRHTTATLLLQDGVNPKIVSERLGHSSIVLTLDVYSHVLPSMQEDATVRLEKMIFR